MVPKNKYDIVIVGAGPAGCTAALYAKKNNLSCLVIDKTFFPRDKICGDAFMPVCETILNELDLSFNELSKNNYYKISNVKFYGNLESLDVPALVYNCKRSVFDDFIFNRTKQKATVLQNCKVLSLLKYNEIVTGISIEYNREVYTINCDCLIGADGASSMIRRLIGIPKMKEYAVASRSYLTYKANYSLFDIKYLGEITPGYFWIFKVSDDSINTGIILYNESDQSQLIELHKKYIYNYFSINVNNDDISTWQLPFINSTDELCVPGCLLIGDAAGLIDPLIGHGIDTAMISAKIAIESILNHKTPLNVCLDYKKEIEQKIVHKGCVNKIFRNSIHDFQNISDQNLLNEYLLHLQKGSLDYTI